MLENPSETNEENLADDSIGATDADAVDNEAIEGEQGDKDSIESEGNDLSDSEIFYEIEGEEVSEADIKKWKAGHFMQSDYTKKTQAHADDVKAFAATKDEFEQKVTLLKNIEKEVEDLIIGDLTKIDMDDLRSNDTPEYLRVKEQLDERKGALSSIAKKRAELENDHYSKEYQSLHKALKWDDEEKQTADKKALSAYLKESGITQQEFAKVTNPKLIIAMLDANKYQQLQKDKASVNKRVLKAPKTSKPQKTSETKVLSLAERMYGTK